MLVPHIEKLGLGTWAFGGRAYGPMDDDVASAVVRRAYDLGIRFFDTAHIYAQGRAEEILGEAIGHFDDAQICTKLGYDVSSGKSVKCYEPDFLDRSLTISLKRLKRSTIDLLLLHNPPTEILERQETFEWLRRQVQNGKIKKWGVSVYDSVRDAELSLNAGASAIEARYSLLRRDVIDDLQTRRTDYHFIARSPFDGGLLPGKHKDKGAFPKTDQRSAWPEETFRAYQEFANALVPLLEEAGADTLAELALRFSAFASKISIVIPGAKSIQQLEQNVAAIQKGPLPAAALRTINDLRQVFLPKVLA